VFSFLFYGYFFYFCYALDSIGVAALALGATAIVAAPILWLLPRWTRTLSPEAR